MYEYKKLFPNNVHFIERNTKNFFDRAIFSIQNSH